MAKKEIIIMSIEFITEDPAVVTARATAWAAGQSARDAVAEARKAPLPSQASSVPELRAEFDALVVQLTTAGILDPR